MSNAYAIYLRKSRADVEAEQRGEGETLSRHRRALTQMAFERGYNVVRIYEEIVSGDTISSRPQMQQLLSAVERGEYAGVIVNDADRLARGDSIDQGIVKQAFFSTNTLIITPIKTYDPSNPADEDFFDVSLFFARFEYKISTRRLQTGRARSAAEGNYLGTRVTYGYNKVKRPDRSGYTLEINPEKAEIVRMVFQWYVHGENNTPMSADEIAKRLNAMGLRTDLGHPFDGGRIRCMLRNPAYIGQSSWNKKIKRIKIVDGVRTIERVRNDAPIIVDNAHPAIIERNLWEETQRIFSTHKKLPKNTVAPVQNVLGGLVRCAQCGYYMQRKPGTGGRPDLIWCSRKDCPTTGIYIPTLENTILEGLRGWVAEYSKPLDDSAKTDSSEAPARSIQKQLTTLRKQMDSLHDLVEQGIYSPVDFVRRRDELTARIKTAEAELATLKKNPTKADLIRAELPKIINVLESYALTTDLALKNELLKSVISYVNYSKTKKCKRGDNPADYLEITIYPAVYPST